MNLKSIEKKAAYLNELKELDKKVIELEKLANNANNNDKNLKITLSAEDINKKQSIKLNEDETDSCTYYFTGGASIKAGTTLKTEEEMTGVSENVDQKHFFIFLHYMLGMYNKRRNFLIKKLTNE